MACRTGCPTQDHVSWGECARAANMRIAYAASARGLDKSTQDRWDKELAAYRSAKEQGIQPNSTKLRDIRRAVEISDKTGVAFQGA